MPVGLIALSGLPFLSARHALYIHEAKSKTKSRTEIKEKLYFNDGVSGVGDSDSEPRPN